MIKGFKDFHIKSPDCHPGAAVYRAHFKLDHDISSVFPYINAVADNALYYENPHYIKFMLNNHKCAAYPEEIIAGVFENRDQALSFFQELEEFINDIFSRRDSIQPDHTKHKYIPVIEIYKQLPKTNCGDCGFATCMAFADAVSKGEADICKCPEYTEEV